MSDHRHYSGLPCTDIGGGVCLIEHLLDDGSVQRFTISHERPDGRGFRCEGTIPVAQASHPAWTMTGSLTGGDLTLSPSVLCLGGAGCGGSHGFVRDGKWVPA